MRRRIILYVLPIVTISHHSLRRIKIYCCKDGLRSLMKGLSYPVYSVGAINSLLFGVYVKCLQTMERSGEGARLTPSYSSILVAGAVSGAAQLILAVPVDLVKVRLQASRGDHGRDFTRCFSTHSRQAESFPMSTGHLL